MNEITPELSLANKRRMAKVARLQKVILDTQVKIKKLQDNCNHDLCTIKPGSNTGGYDGIDYYWKDYTCQICGHWWRGDEETSNIWGR